jgi:hypothetical protein
VSTLSRRSPVACATLRAVLVEWNLWNLTDAPYVPGELSSGPRLSAG